MEAVAHSELEMVLLRCPSGKDISILLVETGERKYFAGQASLAWRDGWAAIQRPNKEDIKLIEVLKRHVVKNTTTNKLFLTGEPAKYMEVAKKEYTAKYNKIFLPGDTGSGFEQVKVTCYQKVMPEDGSILFMQLREFQELHVFVQ